MKHLPLLDRHCGEYDDLPTEVDTCGTALRELGGSWVYYLADS